MSDTDELLKQAFAHSDAGRFEEAAKYLATILRTQPNHPEALHELGMMFMRTGRPRDAASWLTRAAEAAPSVFRYRFNLALLLLRDNNANAAEAVPHFLKAADLASERRDAAALDSVATGLREAGYLTDAANVYRRSLAFRPGGGEAAGIGGIGGVHIRLGLALQEAGKLDEALAAFDAALNLNPNSPEAISNTLLTYTYHDRFPPEEIFRKHVELAERLVPQLPSAGPSARRKPSADGRVRIGYLSPDFCQHSVAFFMLPLLANHDREKYLVTCYADVAKADLITRELQRLSERWRPIYGLSDEHVARQIEADEIDVLVDLAGHTRGNRMSLLAKRGGGGGPIQVNYLGYPNTTGLSTVDYRVTDAVADPVGMTESLHSEKLIRLPSPYSFFCYLTPSGYPDVTPPPAAAMEGKAVTFLVATNFAKVRPASLELWAKVLEAVPNGHLVLQAKALEDVPTHDATARFFAERNLKARVELRGWAHFPEFLESLREMDIALDTFPFNGHTASCNLLWMGIPIVTLAGRAHRSRMGASILTSIGLEELIAENEDDYVRIAAALAADIPRLSELRMGMRERMLKSPMMDAKGFVRKLEALYEQMIREVST